MLINSFKSVFIIALFSCVSSLNLWSLYQDKPWTWCDENLGCLVFNPNETCWYSKLRPNNVRPLERKQIGTKFYYFKSSSDKNDESTLINIDSNFMETLTDTTIIGKPLKIVIHGYHSANGSLFLEDVPPLLLKKGECSVVLVDWSTNGAQPPYDQAVANTRVVGLEVAFLINKLITYLKIEPKDVHCIGYSLGAHICGYAGEKVIKMGRITGLDPAGPLFGGTCNFVHLDSKDATFVDIIHSNAAALTLGTTENIGDLDFYMNNGFWQPGCRLSDLSCSHHKSVYYFKESLSNEKCHFIAHECDSYDSLLQGQCNSCNKDGSGCAVLGLKADEYKTDKENVQFYLMTYPSEISCGYQYSINMTTYRPDGAPNFVNGDIFITLKGKLEESPSIEISKAKGIIYHTKTNVRVFVSPVDVGDITEVTFQWKASVCNLFCFGSSSTDLYIKSISVTPIDYADNIQKKMTAVACGEKKIADNDIINFVMNGSGC